MGPVDSADRSSSSEAPAPDLVEESPGVWRVDLRWMGFPRQVAAYLVVDDGGLAVVESGPASTLPTLLAAVRALGRDPAEISHVLVTHVHLDHAGGAGALLRHAPLAKVHVHPNGAYHLTDPSRLLASAHRIYGDLMGPMWGETRPVDPDRVVVLRDFDEVRVGQRTLRAVDTPGHAIHHHAYHDPGAALIFTGDVGGIRLAELRYVSAPTPPPDIDLEAWRRSVGRLRALSPSLLLPTHFGGARDPEWHLDDLDRRLTTLDEWAAPLVASGADVAALTEAMRARGNAEILSATGSHDAVEAYEQAVPWPMMAAGLHRYLARRATSA